MSKYIVEIEEVVVHTVEVEAADSESAHAAGYEVIMNGGDGTYATDSLGTEGCSSRVFLSENQH